MTNRQLVHIVDDDLSVLHSTGFMLRHAGFDVAEFESGSAFLKIAETTEPGCVLLDMRMAEMDGLAVQREMLDRDIAMPVIILTGQGDIDTAVQSMRLGAANFLEKPYQKEFLLEALTEAFALRESQHLRLIAVSRAIGKAAMSCASGTAECGTLKLSMQIWSFTRAATILPCVRHGRCKSRRTSSLRKLSE